MSNRPVRTVVNTHHHGDHTFGNGLFPGATIVAHEATRQAVLAAGPAPLDMATVLSDMVAFNGGRPLRCLA